MSDPSQNSQLSKTTLKLPEDIDSYPLIYQETAKLYASIGKSSDEIGRLETTLTRSRAFYDQWERYERLLNNQILEKQDELYRKDERIKFCLEKVENYMGEGKELASLLHCAQQLMDELQSKSTEAAKEKQRIALLVGPACAKIDKRYQEMKPLHASILARTDKKKQQILKANEEFLKEKTKLLIEIKLIEQEDDDIAVEVEQQVQDIKTLNAALKNQKDKLDSLRARLELARKMNRQSIEESKKYNVDLNKEAIEEEKQVEDLSTKVQQLKHQEKEMQAELDMEYLDNKTLTEQMGNLHQELNDLSGADECTQELDKIYQERNEMRQVHESLLQEEEQLTGRHREIQNEMQSLKQQITQPASTLEPLIKQLEEVTKATSNMEQVVRQKQKDCDAGEVQIDKIQKEIDGGIDAVKMKLATEIELCQKELNHFVVATKMIQESADTRAKEVETLEEIKIKATAKSKDWKQQARRVEAKNFEDKNILAKLQADIANMKFKLQTLCQSPKKKVN